MRFRRDVRDRRCAEMRRLTLCLLLIFSTCTVADIAHAQPPSGSQLPAEENGCALCHGESKLWQDENLRLYVAPASLAEDVHTLGGVSCHDCHGGDPATLDIPKAHATTVEAGSGLLPFRTLTQGIKETCATCHQEQTLLLRKSVHAHAEREKEGESGRLLSCSKCHGEKMHGMLSVKDRRSPVALDHQVRLCGSCHDTDLTSYTATIHGRGLFESGLVISATCASCHGAHGIFYAADERSTLHSARVTETCGKCHENIGERLAASVHGQVHGPGLEPTSLLPGEKWKRNPSCSDCHPGHRLLKASSSEYRAEISNRCGNCHPHLTRRYAMSTHGELTDLGYTAAAKCSDCHGAHEIVALSDPASPLSSGANRLATCRQCHTYAVTNFSQFDPHADHKDAARYPTLHFIYSLTHGLFLAFFLFFVVHAFLWFVRSFVAVLRGGRHRTLVAGQYVLVKYRPKNRILYMTLLLSFLGLTFTSLPLKYSSQRWAQAFVKGLGGFESTSVWHHFFGAVAIICCIVHVARGVNSLRERRERREKWREILFGPDSPVPGRRDVKEIIGMARWFLGLGSKPAFERWTYWEKWDYWMACLACLLVGGSGLMMWFPNFFCRFVSGETLNVGRVIHVELAVLSTSFLFVFHVYHTHFRPEKFPLDLSAITGLVNEGHLRKNRPDYVARLEETHTLDDMRRPSPSRRHLWFSYLLAALLFSVGLCLLAVALAASLGK